MKARFARVGLAMKTIALAVAALALGAGAARAQIALPPLPPPLGGVTQAVPALGERLGVDEVLVAARRLQVRALLRTHHEALEADPNGEPIVRRRVLAIGASPAALEAAQAAGFSIEARDEIDGLGALVTLAAPPGMSTARALRRLRRLDPEGTYDFDHLHLPSAAGVGAVTAAPPPAGAARLRIGLIDTGVGADMAPAVAVQRGFAGPAAVPGAHGEIVAGLLAAEGGVALVVADIYGGAPTGGASSTLARALAWLAREGPPVINVSLVGPRNRVVEAVVAQLVGRGFLIVAAVGNDGPAAAPLYPAAYPGVVGVTGTDARDRVLVEAGRGPQVDFAALGAPSGLQARGTSFAAPVVARTLAQALARPDPTDAARALAHARALARDLGPRGRDDIYGDGLIAPP